MKYAAADFGNELYAELDRGYDSVRISRWAMATYMQHSGFTDALLDIEIMRIVAMEEGPEFELTEEQLREIAQRLIG